jgi:hypothetical protein
MAILARRTARAGFGAGPVVQTRAGHTQRLAHPGHRQHTVMVVVGLLRGHERIVAHQSLTPFPGEVGGCLSGSHFAYAFPCSYRTNSLSFARSGKDRPLRNRMVAAVRTQERAQGSLAGALVAGEPRWSAAGFGSPTSQPHVVFRGDLRNLDMMTLPHQEAFSLIESLSGGSTHPSRVPARGRWPAPAWTRIAAII